MPVVPTTAYSQADDALTLARALMNDSAGAVFTDALLMPLINSAYRGLQRELAENGVSVLAEQQDIDLGIQGLADLAVALVAGEAAVEDLAAVSRELRHRLVDGERLVEPAQRVLRVRDLDVLLGRLLARYAGLDQAPVIARTGRCKPYAPALAGMPRPGGPVRVRDASATDTDALLREAGLAPEKIEALRTSGVIS